MKRFSCPFALALVSLIISANLPASEILDQVPLPDFHKQSLLNGMEILFLPGSGERLPFLLMIKNGAAFDPVDKWGLTYVMVRLAMEGTEFRTGSELREDLEKIGAEVDFRVDWDAIFFFGSAPAEELANALNILGEIVVRPRFDEDTFQAVRARVLQEVEKEQEQVENLTETLLISRLFKGNPYEHPVSGIAETLRNLYLADVKIQYRRLFMPNHAQLALYHSRDRDALFTALSRRWGSWVRGDPLPFTFRQAGATAGRDILLLDQPLKEGLLRWAKLGVEKGARHYYGLQVFAQYVTLSLPEWAQELTSESHIKALARVEARKMPGYIQFSVQAPVSQLALYVRKFHTLLQELQNSRLDPARLDEARKLVFLEFKNSFDDPLSRLYRLLEADLYDLGINYITHYGPRLNRVTAESLQELAQELLSPHSYLMVVAGPAPILQPNLADWGRVVAAPSLESKP